MSDLVSEWEGDRTTGTEVGSFFRQEGERMRNKDELKGKTERFTGRVKEEVGRMTDNPDLEGEGLGDQAVGSVRETYGKGRRKVGEVIEDIGEDLKR